MPIDDSSDDGSDGEEGGASTSAGLAACTAAFPVTAYVGLFRVGEFTHPGVVYWCPPNRPASPSSAGTPHRDVRIRFPDAKTSEVAMKVLEVDAELQKTKVARRFSTEGQYLCVYVKELPTRLDTQQRRHVLCHARVPC